MSSPSEHVPTPDLSGSVGALLVGILFSVCLFGVTSLQVWYYYQHYPGDSKGVKLTVAVLWILELLHVVFGCHAIYFYLILNFANFPALNISVWSADMTLLVTGFIVLISHSFFARRVWILGRKQRTVPAVIILLAIATASCTWGVVGISVAAKDFSKYPHSIVTVSTLALSLSVATDVLIAVSLGYYLHAGRTGFARTDNIINKLIFWAVNIGILTSAIDLAVLILSRTPTQLMFLAVFEVVGNLYANSLLATLNIRPMGRSQVLNEDGTSLQLSEFQPYAPSTSISTQTRTKIVPDESAAGSAIAIKPTESPFPLPQEWNQPTGDV